MNNIQVNIGNIVIGGGNPVVVQTMCNTRTSDVEASVAQCRRLYAAGAQMIRLAVPTLKDVEYLGEIRERLRAENIAVPIVADVHFSPEIAIAAASVVDKVRINPGNFHKDHDKACEQFARLIEVCKQNGTAIRIGVNHGSLGERITSLYGNTPLAMAEAAMEWLRMCLANKFLSVVISLKASNTIVMVEAYRILMDKMKKLGKIFPLHLGLTEAGNGDAGRIKSIVAISALLADGIGDTIRVSLTEDPENELAPAKYLALRKAGKLHSSIFEMKMHSRNAVATYNAPSREQLLYDISYDLGKMLLDKTIDTVQIRGTYIDEHRIPQDIASSGLDIYFANELLQAARRRFYRPEYIACPGCGRTMYNLQETLEKVKESTAHLRGMVIAVMGCIVNGPGEMADADWGYVGEGSGKVSIYRGKTPVMRHIPENEAVERLLQLIEHESAKTIGII